MSYDDIILLADVYNKPFFELVMYECENLR